MSVEIDLTSGNMMTRVEMLLLKYEQIRDDDKMLWLAYCSQFCSLKQNMSDYEKFKSWLLSNKVPTFESLSRARRKIQEHNPLTRGKHYKVKQESAQTIADWAVGR